MVQGGLGQRTSVKTNFGGRLGKPTPLPKLSMDPYKYGGAFAFGDQSSNDHSNDLSLSMEVAK